MKEEKHFTQQIIKYQEEVKEYIGDGKYHFTVLNHEALVIFCIETGENYVVKHTVTPTQ